MKEAKKMLGLSDGIMGNLAGAAFERIKQAVPAGGRVGLGASGAMAGGVAGGIGGTFRSIPKAIGQMKTGQVAEGFSSIGQGFISGLGTGIKKGASAGVNITSSIERSAGLNQPDILNPLTHFIDTGETPFKSKATGEPIPLGKGLATGKNRERATKRQEVEDFIDLANRSLGKPENK